MRFKDKDFEIPQVCLDLGFEDMSHLNEEAGRMYNSELDICLWVHQPGSGKKRYTLFDCGNGRLGEGAETDDELRELVAWVREEKRVRFRTLCGV